MAKVLHFLVQSLDQILSPPLDCKFYEDSLPVHFCSSLNSQKLAKCLNQYLLNKCVFGEQSGEYVWTLGIMKAKESWKDMDPSQSKTLELKTPERGEV